MADAKYEFDETRSAIGANELDNQERKEMLERFKSAGGQVLKEKSVAEKAEAARQAAEARSGGGGNRGVGVGGGGGTGLPETKLPSQLRREREREESEKAQRSRQEYEKALKKLSGPGAKFMIRLRCFLAGVAPFSGRSIKPSFVQFLNLEVKQALIEFNLIGNDLFLQRPTIGKKIMQNLDGKNPLLMETLEYAHHMYNSEYFSALSNAAQSGSSVATDSVIASLKSIYRTLYILYPFQETFKKAMGYALDIFTPEAQSAKLSQESIQGMIIKQKRFHTNTKAVFQTAFPKLFHLICLADGTDYPPFSPLLEKAIQVAENDKLGQRKKGDESSLEGSVAETPVEAAGEEKPEEKKEEEKKGGIYDTKEYQYGASLMKINQPPALVERYDKSKRMLEKVAINDRILLSYLYFLEFDYEYSFALTTNKIVINVDYSGGVKSDYKKQMADLYNESRAIIKAYEKYEEMLQEYKQAKDRKSTNYIEKSKLEEKAKGRADMEGRNTRGLIRTFMENVAKSMAFLITDMKGAKQIVGNMEDLIKFDSELERKKRLNGKPVKQCIMDAYCYAVTFKERLANGDLFPLTPMTDEEMIASFGSTFGAAPPQTTEQDSL
jgi:hypothetical protein